ncbi:MAG: hypothetical protein JO345_19555 [Streptosporangiaceae bacterium]|nr:hypothetical protein [Streptosporangiaceae bacterium]
MRVAVPLAIPVALGLTLGIVLAVSGGHTTPINPSALGASATPSASAMATGSGAAAAASPTASATTAAPAAAAPNVSCELIVPPNALTAQGLATPWQLTGPNGNNPQGTGCTMANFANLGAFVQATIIDPATGQLNTYEPLVVTQGTQPAIAPQAPNLPAGAVITYDIGFNGTNLTLINSQGTNSVAQANCVNGLPGSIFGQVSFCNAANFFNAANNANLNPAVPALGMTNMGQACPTTRSFVLIDQDQSDNVTTRYLITANGQTAQDGTVAGATSAANTQQLQGATLASNGSDNALLNGFVDPAVGCKPFTVPDLSNNNQPGTSQALDELVAAKDQQAPIAEVPLNDPMTLNNNNQDANKTNLYRQQVDQQPLGANQASDSPASYCANMLNLQSKFINDQRANLLNGPSPVPATGNNLFTFLAARLSMSFTNLGCQNFGLKNPVNLTLDGNGVAINASINVMTQTPANPNGNGNNGAAGSTTANQPANGKTGQHGAPARHGQNPGQ